MELESEGKRVVGSIPASGRVRKYFKIPLFLVCILSYISYFYVYKFRIKTRLHNVRACAGRISFFPPFREHPMQLYLLRVTIWGYLDVAMLHHRAPIPDYVIV